MSLLTLRGIGKIYVSEQNAAVGIRGIDLSLSRGELVAVTGKSGSGKSTLLNVISGMDTYEEGELLINGEPTSHYLQADWEAYRERFVSFIFQDYNIIDSFTVLQNVELALLHISDRRARRRRALELIRRVGLSAHARHKASHLSGGQKQRTVIARALAKDSPIILADEPTGNLDAATSREIMALLREVSRNKLLVIVTHDFDEVKDFATRHIRIFDGAIEFDRVLKPHAAAEETEPAPSRRRSPLCELWQGLSLGRAIFSSRPRLSAFLSAVLLIGMLGVFAITSLTAGGITLFDKHYMFTPSEGRLILSTPSGRVVGAAELAALAERHGAEDYLSCDYLLDLEHSVYAAEVDTYLGVRFRRGTKGLSPSVGRAPRGADEAMLSLPISYQPIFGKDGLAIQALTVGELTLRLTGVSYYYDNNRPPSLCLTEEGFRLASASLYLRKLETKTRFSIFSGGGEHIFSFSSLVPAFDLASGGFYVDDPDFLRVLDGGSLTEAVIVSYGYYGSGTEDGVCSLTLSPSSLSAEAPSSLPALPPHKLDSVLYVSPDLVLRLASEVTERAYRQSSLFFGNDRKAERAAESLRDEGYIAVLSTATYSPEPFELIAEAALSILLLLLWGAAILFLSTFVSLCTGRAIGTFRADAAIMRSMGIPVRIIRLGMYARTLFALIPVSLLFAAAAVTVYLLPQTNAFFVFLYPIHYAAIALGLCLVALLATRRQIRRLFSESVKQALRGGDAA